MCFRNKTTNIISLCHHLFKKLVTNAYFMKPKISLILIYTLPSMFSYISMSFYVIFNFSSSVTTHNVHLHNTSPILPWAALCSFHEYLIYSLFPPSLTNFNTRPSFILFCESSSTESPLSSLTFHFMHSSCICSHWQSVSLMQCSVSSLFVIQGLRGKTIIVTSVYANLFCWYYLEVSLASANFIKIELVRLTVLKGI